MVHRGVDENKIGECLELIKSGARSDDSFGKLAFGKYYMKRVWFYSLLDLSLAGLIVWGMIEIIF
jgi:hypothetical protein